MYQCHSKSCRFSRQRQENKF